MTALLDSSVLQGHAISPPLTLDSSCYFSQATTYYKQVVETSSSSVLIVPKWQSVISSSASLLTQESYEHAYHNLLLKRARHLRFLQLDVDLSAHDFTIEKHVADLCEVAWE